MVITSATDTVYSVVLYQNYSCGLLLHFSKRFLNMEKSIVEHDPARVPIVCRSREKFNLFVTLGLDRLEKTKRV